MALIELTIWLSLSLSCSQTHPDSTLSHTRADMHYQIAQTKLIRIIKGIMCIMKHAHPRSDSITHFPLLQPTITQELVSRGTHRLHRM